MQTASNSELIEYRDGLRGFQDRIAGSPNKNNDLNTAKVTAWLSELLSLSISDVDRQLSNRVAHPGDLAQIQHGVRLATALLKVFEAADYENEAIVKMSATMTKVVAAIGANLYNSQLLVDHFLAPPDASRVN